MLGPFAAVTATGTLTETGVDAQECVTVTGATGALGVLHASMLARSACTASVCGTDGRLEVDGWFYAPNRVRWYDRGGALLDTFEPAGDTAHEGLRYEAAEVARCLTAGATESPVLPLATTVRIMEAMDAVRRQLGVGFPGE